MVTDGKSIVCPKCGNDTFVRKGSMIGGFNIGCSKCGEGKIFGAGLTARTVASILRCDIVKGDE